MKKYILITLHILFSLRLSAQFSVGYAYDANGNRIQRYFVGLRPINPNLQNTPDSTKVLEEMRKIADDKGVKIYPNPTSGQINVFISKPGKDEEEQQNIRIFILDNSGKTLKQEKYKGTETSFNIESFPPGSYNIKIVFNDKESLTYKIIKVN